ncbi:hypothetical protein BDN72DRAFT_890780 [Pluteus cervinus]|uniref:Uncharacterized protein n=1 Tax=Pluteus cervinus TaxID=181527 RepID=A0ACD3BH50_9AGAR|nr:hypothetical protein BDN72DRAFT_890780 [Pluteus cervinus]
MLDDIHSESLAQCLVRLRPQRQLTVLPSVPLTRGDIVEIQGPHTSGKSHLVYLLAITCILPPSHLDVIFDGWGHSAVVMDTDGSFSIARFAHLLRQHIDRLFPNTYSREQVMQEIFTASLTRLHVFWPNSTSQLAATICHLPAHLASKYPGQEIGMIAIDSMSAFHWQDRFTVEQLRQLPTSTIPGGIFAPSRPDAPLSSVLLALQDILKVHRSLVILANWGLNKNNTVPPVGGIMLYNQHLRQFPELWGGPHTPSPVHDTSIPITLTHRITMGNPVVAQNRIGVIVGQDADTGDHSATGSPTVIHAVVHKKTDVTDYFTLCISGDIVEAN